MDEYTHKDMAAAYKLEAEQAGMAFKAVYTLLSKVRDGMDIEHLANEMKEIEYEHGSYIGFLTYQNYKNLV